MAKIQPIKRPSVGEMVCEQLKEFLFDGRWKPGDKIPPENDLAKAFGVSRVTIREALLRLSSLGLLESRFGGGTYVREITPGLNMQAIVPAAYLDSRSVLDVIEFRQVMEVKTAGLAARRADPADIDDLREITARMAKHRNDAKKFAAADLDFHLQLAKITRNSLIIETMNVIKGFLDQTIYRVVKHRGHSQALAFHKRLLDAIERRDEAAAMRIMEEHVDNMYTLMEKSLNEKKQTETDEA